MKTIVCLSSGILAVAMLAGCGGGGASEPVSSSFSTSQQSSGTNQQAGSTTTGSVVVQVTNPALPAGTTALLYSIVDSSTGDTLAQQRVAYSSGQPVLQLFGSLPSEIVTIEVTAVDAGGNVLIQGVNQLTVPNLATVTDELALGTATALSQLQFFSQPANVAIGASETTLVIQLIAANNTLATQVSDPITLSLTPNGAAATISAPSLSPPAAPLKGGPSLTVTPVSGFATFTGVTASALGTGYTLVATASSGPTATSNSFSVVSSAGAPAQLVFTVQPSTTTEGEVITPAPQVAVEDANGVVVGAASNPITIATGNNPSNAFLAGPGTLNAVQGMATFNGLSLNAQGTAFTLAGSSPGLISVTSSAFDSLNDQSGVTPPTGNVDQTGSQPLTLDN